MLETELTVESEVHGTADWHARTTHTRRLLALRRVYTSTVAFTHTILKSHMYKVTFC